MYDICTYSSRAIAQERNLAKTPKKKERTSDQAARGASTAMSGHASLLHLASPHVHCRSCFRYGFAVIVVNKVAQGASAAKATKPWGLAWSH